MKQVDVEIRAWHSRLADESNEMMAELLDSMLARHQFLSAEYLQASQEKDQALQGLHRIDKELRSVNKQISRGDVDRRVLSDSILQIAASLGEIIGELQRISKHLIATRRHTVTVAEMVAGFVEEVSSSREKWVQSSEGIDAIYSDFEERTLPENVRKLQDAFDQSRLDLFLARAHGDDSKAATEKWRSQLNSILMKKSSTKSDVS